MTPRTHDKKILGVRRVLGFNRAITMNSAPHVLLIPDSLNPHGGNRERLLAHDHVKRLLLPKLIIRRMRHKIVPHLQFFQARSFCKVARGTSAKKIVVVIGTGMNNGETTNAPWTLTRKVIQRVLAKRAVVIPIVAHPTINHGTHGRRNFQRGMRIDQRHDHGETFVGTSGHANAAVAFRNIFHKPIDGVVCIS